MEEKLLVKNSIIEDCSVHFFGDPHTLELIFARSNKDLNTQAYFFGD
jgi:hypothetical protein